MENCQLCLNEGGAVLWRDGFCRIVRVGSGEFSEFADYPGFLRVILERHVSEMTTLPKAERDRLMGVVYACEQLVRDVFRPDKINLASLGNVVPHLHWHVTARHSDDRHFPDSVWSAPRRTARKQGPSISDELLAARLEAAIGRGTALA
jgi:diadenosine tetraphosphate (Ap4A) HIT family hydrolase